MKLNKISEINEFLATVNKCEGGVTLTSLQGDKYNLKSSLSQYLAIGALLGEHGDELELWCDNKDDEIMFVKFLYDHPQMI